ncbi:MAG TPA: MarR family transcriptional regulator [Pyrinomonadaceae bacterium]|jgi:DNA-binding MarR family transcriptional regulator
MSVATSAKVLEVMSSFAEVMSRLLLDQHQKQLAELDLTLLQAQVLRLLRRGPVLTGQLAVELGISAPAITQLTDRLMRKQLIERRASAADRRAISIALTAKGKRLVDQFRQRRRDIFNEALKSLDEPEQSQVASAMEKIVAALEEYEQRMAKKYRRGINKGTSDRSRSRENERV